MAYQPLSSLTPGAGYIVDPNNPNAVIKAPSSSMPGSYTAPIGVKTVSPQDNIKTPTNTTPQPQIVKPQGGTQSTETGTQNNDAGVAFNQQMVGTKAPPAPTAPQFTTPTNAGLYGQLIGAGANASSNAVTQGQNNYNTGTSNVQNFQQQGPYGSQTLAVLAAQKRAQDIQGQATQLNQSLNQGENDITKKPIPLEFQQGQQAALQRDYGVQAQSLAQQAGYATTNAQNLAQNALSAQGQGLSAGSTLLNSGLSAQGQGISGLYSGASGAAQQFPSYNSAQYNPVSGTYSTVGGGQYGSGPQAGANISTIQDFTHKYNSGNANLAQASSLEDQIAQTLQSNPSLNNTNISALNNLSDFLSGQSSDPSQQLLSQQVANYIRTLGLDTGTALNIAHQQRGTLAQLLSSLRDTATSNNKAFNPAKLNFNQQNNSSNDPLGIL